MSRTITLTTPLTHGAHVERAQRILTNRGYFVGAIDGIFGELTARACSEAKYKLGYASANIKPSYGTELERFLTGKRKPTPLMRVRAARRSAKKPIGVEALAIGKQYVGTKEDPAGSNKVLFSDWYGIRGPWCAMFVTYCFVKAGSKAFVRGQRWAYCPFILEDARQNHNGLTLIRDHDLVKSGDIVLYSWHKDGVANHVGIVVTPPNGGISFIALEGNTAVGNDSNGGEVMVRQRHTDDVIGFVRAVR